MERIPSMERGCKDKIKLGKGYKKRADAISKKHGRQQGVYLCTHCSKYHLTTKIENSNKYNKQLVYVTPIPEQASSSSTFSLPKEFDGKFYGVGSMGKIFIKTKCGDTNVLDVRGWAYLTGRGGGLAMDEHSASETQDQFEAWVIEALNAYRERANQDKEQI